MFILKAAIITILGVVASKNDQRDPASNQILCFKNNTEGPVGAMTTSNGAPVTYSEATCSLNTRLINHELFMDSITHLNREKIPERIVHAKGSGAFGYFEVTNNISHICKASFLKKVGEKTPVAVRFSLASGERGASELGRLPRGFAVKFYTEEGNFDIIGFNTPTFNFKDPLHFPDFVHGQNRNPATNLIDPNILWDLLTLVPEALHTFLLIFADRGIPASYQNMPGYSIHTYQVENKTGKLYFLRFHILPDAGIKNLRSKKAQEIGAVDPDYFSRSLYRDIANGKFPKWTISVQILTESDVKKAGSRIFDVTRVISLNKHPLYEVGKLVLNRNAENYFAEVEQLAFCPSNLVPGIKGGPDKIFESRRLAYRDTQLYRLGVNFQKIPVNCPFRVKTFTYNRDGRAPVNKNGKDFPNYRPNSFHGAIPVMKKQESALIKITEDKADNFDQVSQLYSDELTSDERERLVENLTYSLRNVTAFIKNRAIKLFTTINPDLGNRVKQGLHGLMICH